jgi:hypothetical protein
MQVWQESAHYTEHVSARAPEHLGLIMSERASLQQVQRKIVRAHEHDHGEDARGMKPTHRCGTWEQPPSSWQGSERRRAELAER